MARVVTILALLLLTGLAAASNWPVEHSLDGGRSWSVAGHISVLATSHTGTAVLEREPLSADQRAQLTSLLAGDGLYRLRLPSSAAPGAPRVAASFPARCLGAASAERGLELDLLDARHVAALALSAPCSPGSASADADLQLPASQALALRLPAAAPEVLPPLLGQGGPGMPGMPAQPGAAAAAAAGAAGAAGSQGAQGQQQGGKAPGGKRAPPPDDRTWLQKNWMMVLPLGFIVMNLLGQAAGPPPQGPQRPGAGSPAAVRAAPARR